LTDEIGKIDRAVAGIVRIDSEIDQAAMRQGQHFRDAGYCAGLASAPDKLQMPCFFGDEKRAVGQKSNRTRLIERPCDPLGGQLRPLSQNDFGFSGRRDGYGLGRRAAEWRVGDQGRRQGKLRRDRGNEGHAN
jgi:hypothetical protein